MSNFASIRMGAFSKRTLHLKTLFSLIIFKGTVMQIEKALINDCLRVSEVSKKNSHSNYMWFCSNLSVKFVILLKSSLLFNNFYCLFCL